MTPPQRILVVDDDKLYRDALELHLEDQPDLQIVGQARSRSEARSLALSLHPDLVLLDLRLEGDRMAGIAVMTELRKQDAERKVLVLSHFDDEEHIQKAYAAGAAGYLIKDELVPDELVRALREVARGRVYFHPKVQKVLHQSKVSRSHRRLVDDLTDREQDVLRLIDLSNREIAEHLGISEGNVKDRVSVILQKLQVTNRTRAALLGVRLGLIELKDP